MTIQSSPVVYFIRSIALLIITVFVVSCGSSGSSGSDPSSESTDATLASITLTAGSVDPVFDPSTTSYTVSVGNTVDSTTLTVTTSDTNAMLVANGVAITSGVATAAASLDAGSNIFTIVVTASDDTTTQTYTVNVHRAPESFELIDPNAAAGNFFGQNLTILANGNIVTPVGYDSSIVDNNGAVHLFNPYTQSIVASLYGDNEDDYFGTLFGSVIRVSGIEALANGNFVISSPNDMVGGLNNAGSVTLVNGTTGDVIGTPISGDVASDLIGSHGVVVLTNDNYVILSPDDNLNVTDGGSVMLVNGNTGELIGSPIGGDVDDDYYTVDALALPNGNYVVTSSYEDSSTANRAGSVTLMNGETGVQIGSTFFGTTALDGLSSGQDAVLSNSNFIIASPNYDGVATDTGAVMLFNGSTGALITTIEGDNDSDKLGLDGITALANNNFVIASSDDDIGAVTDGGSVILVNGATGVEIARFNGETDDDSVGTNPGVTGLSNGHYVIAASLYDVGGNTNAGSAKYMNGLTGTRIGTAFEGDSSNDSIGLNGVTELTNAHFVIISSSDDISGTNVGSVKLVDGTTGTLINQVVGDANNDAIGGSGVTALPNGNYAVASRGDDSDLAVVNAGSVMVLSGVDGTQIGSTIYGDTTNDYLGYMFDAPIALSNSHFVVISEFDDESGITDAGSMLLIDGNTGLQLNKVVGLVADDFDVKGTGEDFITESPLGDYFLMAVGTNDNNGEVDSGVVRLFTQ